MRFALRVMTVLTCLCVSLVAYAHNALAVVSGDWMYEERDGTATIEQYRGSDTEVVIPSELDGYPVTHIGSSSFAFTDAESVVIPEGVVNIDELAFSYSSGLKKLSIPSTVTEIGPQAFVECSSLTVTVSDDNPCYCVKDRGLYTKDMTTLVFVCNAGNFPTIVGEYQEDDGFRVPQGVTTIAAGACAESNIRRLRLPESLITIGENAFYGCWKLGMLSIPSGVTNIGYAAFMNCDSLKKVSLPVSVAYVGGSVFDGCSDALSIRYVGSAEQWASVENHCDGIEGLLRYDQLPFSSDMDFRVSNGTIVKYKGAGIGEVGVPESIDGKTIQRVGSGAFKFEKGITSLVFNSNIYEVGDNAFAGMSGMTSIKGVEGLGNVGLGSGAFSSCSSLASLDFGDSSLVRIMDNTFAGCSSLEKVVLPDSVRFIYDWAFQGCKSLHDFELPPSLETIGKYAFSGCASLEKLTFPDGVTKIDEQAFQGCSSLKSVRISNATLCDYVFSDCTALEEAVIDSRMTYVPAGCFEGCSNLKLVHIPNEVKNIYENAFDGCAALPAVTLPSGLETISEAAFKGCASLEEIDLPNGLREIGDLAFRDCELLKSVNMPDSVQALGYSAFSNCANLESLRFSAQLSEIPSHVLSGSNSLREVVIPEGCTSLAEEAFFGARVLMMSLPKSLITIGKDAFGDCILVNVTYAGSEEQWASVRVEEGNDNLLKLLSESATGFRYLYDPDTNTLTIIGQGAIPDFDYENSYDDRPGFSERTVKRLVIGDGITHIGSEAFKQVMGLEEVVFSDTVESIGPSAFYGNNELTAVTFGDGLASIADDAFRNCWALRSIALPRSLKTIGDHAFDFCYELESITLPEGLTTIGAEAFTECQNLTNVAIPSSVTKLGNRAFAWCSSLKSLTLPGSIKEIPEEAFRGCEGLETVSIGEGTTSVRTRAFDYCTSLYEVSLPASLTSIGEDAFCDTALQSITIPRNVTSIADMAFFPNLRTICGYAGGYAEQYARVYDYEFVGIGLAFIDVTTKTPHVDDVLWLADSGISTGWAEEDGLKTFRPTKTVIRQDMAAFLFRLAKLWGVVDDSWQPSGSVTFTDVTASTPHYHEIMWLAESGVSAGWTVGGQRQFRPTNTVVRQDMAAFLRRLQALRDPSVKTWKPTGGSPFRDVTASTPHYEDIVWLAQSGVSAGWTVGGAKEFRPMNTVIRQDMAAFLHRLDGVPVGVELSAASEVEQEQPEALPEDLADVSAVDELVDEMPVEDVSGDTEEAEGVDIAEVEVEPTAEAEPVPEQDLEYEADAEAGAEPIEDDEPTVDAAA